jgi:type IV secretion system protein VirB10
MDSRQAEAAPNSTLQADPPEMVSVNSRGGTSSNLGAKVAFAVVIFALVMAGGLIGLNKWRAAKKEGETRIEAASKTENKPAQVGVRRNFDVDAPPPLPTPASGVALLKAGGPAQGAQPACADGSPSTVAIGPDGGVMSAPGGGFIRVCRDGKLMVPAIETQSSASPTGAPPPIGVRPTGAGATAQGTPLPSRYSGDVMVVSGGMGGAATQSPTGPLTNPLQTLQMMQEMLGRGQGGQGTGAASTQPAATIPVAAGTGNAGTPSPAGSIGTLLTPSQTPMVQAALIGDRNLLLPKGRTVDCSLSTRVVSDLAGMATCVLSSNVYSDNGRVVLLERGSEAVGEYGSAVVQGQRRLFVLWTRVKTPSGVVINLNSPAADALGTSGLEGYVDNHWWERVGAAFLLSFVQDAIAYKTAEATGGGGAQGTAVFQNSSQTGNRLAEKILDSTINIKPTLYKNQGDRATIFVARDLDFGTVYALRAR